MAIGIVILLLAIPAGGETQAVFLMHLSRENYPPELALMAARESLSSRTIHLEVARPFEPTSEWEGG